MRKRKHHRLERYYVRMHLGSNRMIDRTIMGTSAYDAALRISEAHLASAPVFPGRREGTEYGYPLYSYAVEGFGQRMYVIRKDATYR